MRTNALFSHSLAASHWAISPIATQRSVNVDSLELFEDEGWCFRKA